MAAVRNNSDFFLLFWGTEGSTRHLLSCLGSGKNYKNLQLVLKHSILGQLENVVQNNVDFRLSKPHLLLTANPDCNRYFRYRECLNNLKKDDAIKPHLPMSFLNVKEEEETKEEEEEEEKEEEEEEEGRSSKSY